MLLPPGGVHGTVRAVGGEPLARVQVQVDGRVRAVTDSVGSYSVRPLGVGVHDLQFIASGYLPRRMSVLLGEGSDIALDVSLARSIELLPAISVTAAQPGSAAVSGPTELDGSHELGRYRVVGGWQNAMMAQGIDVQKALAGVPGVIGRGDNATSLSIRGGSASENLLLLDGIPIYGGSHFGNASSAILPDAISFMDVHTGVSSARFGGRLSGVVELETVDSSTGTGVLSGAVTGTDVRAMVRGASGGLAAVT